MRIPKGSGVGSGACGGLKNALEMPELELEAIVSHPADDVKETWGCCKSLSASLESEKAATGEGGHRQEVDRDKARETTKATFA